jgi:hypothetical protein
MEIVISFELHGTPNGITQKVKAGEFVLVMVAARTDAAVGILPTMVALAGSEVLAYRKDNRQRAARVRC